MVVMLKQCCCGCSLKTGTIIIGALNLIGAVLGLANGIVLASTDLSEHGVQEDTRTIGIVAAIFGAVMIIISILLLVGATKGRPGLLTPWLICSIVIMVAYVIMYIVGGVAFFNQGASEKGASYIVGAIIYVLLETYFILVVYSLYRELKGTA